MNATTSKETPIGGCLERLVRPPDASIDGLRKCLRWLDACREIGLADEVMPDLEGLFWQYHDKDGNKKPNAERSHSRESL